MDIVEVEEIELGIKPTSDKIFCQAAIKDNQDRAEVWCADGSKAQDGKAGVGWSNGKSERRGQKGVKRWGGS